MITRLSHASLFVLDQEKAYDFYVNKLGFKVHTDVKMENGFRWLTLTAPEQPGLEIAIVQPLHPGMHNDEETQNAFRVRRETGALGAGVVHPPRGRATHEVLKAKGVVFKCQAKEQFYATEATI